MIWAKGKCLCVSPSHSKEKGAKTPYSRVLKWNQAEPWAVTETSEEFGECVVGEKGGTTLHDSPRVCGASSVTAILKKIVPAIPWKLPKETLVVYRKGKKIVLIFLTQNNKINRENILNRNNFKLVCLSHQPWLELQMVEKFVILKIVKEMGKTTGS